MKKNKTGFLSQLQWRFATKKFDPKKQVSDNDVKTILEAIRMSPSSFGLQQYHVYVIQNKKIQNDLMKLSYLQRQVLDASAVLVFCARTDIQKRINDYEKLTTQGKLTEKLKFAPVKLIMNAMVGKRKGSELLAWSNQQTYIALGFALAASAELNIDSCPIEGFDAKKTDVLLKLPEYLHSVVLLPIGYRKEDPKRKKVRFPAQEMFTLV